MELLYFFFLSLLLLFLIKLFSQSQRSKNLPPSPFALPILGHLHLFKNPLYRTLQTLSTRYGPMVFLQFGARRILLISSQSLVEECFIKNDIAFANRPLCIAGEFLTYNYTMFAWSPYGYHWRDVRRITTIEIFSSKSLQLSSAIRKDEIKRLISYLFRTSNGGSQHFDLKFMFSKLMYNIMMRMVAGKRCFEEELMDLDEQKKVHGVLKDIFVPGMVLRMGDFLPILRWIDIYRGEKNLIKLMRKRDTFLQNLIDEYRRNKIDSSITNKPTIIEALLSIQEAEPTSKTTLLFFFLLFSSQTAFSKPLDYQTLLLKPLSKPPAYTPDHDLTFSESQTTEATATATLSLPLHHIDSLSPTETAESLFTLQLQRDALRVNTLTSLTAARRIHPRTNSTDFSSSIVSGLPQGSGEYFTRLGVGTPPRYSYMVLDTGSDIVWLQCAPCRKCYSQSDPVFDPTKSTSFKHVACKTPLCAKLDVSGCNQKNSCLYQVSYGDGSFTVGEFSTETLTFRGRKVENVGFGCGHDNEGLFVGAAGLLGLGRGGLSFTTQTGRRFGRKFSYCLVDRTSSNAKASAIVFGESSVPRSAVFTPMISNPKLDTFYYLELAGVSVGGTRVAGISSSLFKLDTAGNGGVIIDSGTSVTRLTRPAYVALRDAFRSGAVGLKRAPGFSLFDTCFDLAGKTEVKVPTVVMHLGGGADVSLPASNYLIPVNSQGVFCFAFAGTSGGLSIIGNIQQQGFRIVFDSAGSRIGFAPHSCD